MVYIKLLEKLISYVSYKLIVVIKFAEENGLSIPTGELLTN